MANFQLIVDPFLLKRPWLFRNGTRLFVSGDAGVERLTLQSDRVVQLEVVGTVETSSGRALPRVVSSDRSVADIVKTVSFEKLGKQTVTLKAKGVGNAVLKGEAAGSIDPLEVVVGDFKPHTGMTTDLLADVCDASDLAKIHQVNRRLYDPAGGGAYRIPDVYVPGARSIFDATIAEKTISLPKTIDFRAFSGGGNVTIIRPSTLVTPGAQGSYGLRFP